MERGVGENLKKRKSYLYSQILTFLVRCYRLRLPITAGTGADADGDDLTRSFRHLRISFCLADATTLSAPRLDLKP